MTLEELGLAALSLVLAVAVAAWAYGVYAYVQMVRHRRPGVDPLSFAWPVERLTQRGREFRRRALQSYLVFGVLAILAMVLSRLLEA